jgi:hypothetical protein
VRNSRNGRSAHFRGETGEFCDPRLASVSTDDELRLDLLLGTICAIDQRASNPTFADSNFRAVKPGMKSTPGVVMARLPIMGSSVSRRIL